MKYCVHISMFILSGYFGGVSLLYAETPSASHSQNLDEPSSSNKPRSEGEGNPSDKEKDQQKREEAAISALKIDKEKSGELRKLFGQVRDSEFEIERNKSSDQESNAKLIPLFKSITDQLSETQLKDLDKNDQILAALGLQAEDKSKQKELLLKTAQERLRFIRFYRSSYWGQNFTSPQAPGGACVGVECARNLNATAEIQKGSKPALKAIDDYFKSKTFPENITLPTGKEVPATSDEGIKAVAEIMARDGNGWIEEEKRKYMKARGIKTLNEMEDKVSFTNFEALKAAANDPQAQETGLSVTAFSTVRDAAGKIVYDRNGQPARDLHAITILSVGAGDNKTLVVRDPNFKGIGGDVSMDSSGRLSYQIRTPDGKTLNAYWEHAYPLPQFWK